MRIRYLIPFGLLLMPISLAGQVSNPSIIIVASPPSGNCSANLPWQYAISNGTGWYCGSVTAGTGTWAQIGSAVGSGTVSGQAANVVPLGTSATVIGNQSHISEAGGQDVFSQPIAPSSAANALTSMNNYGVPVNVIDYGAKCDGVTDDSAAINTAASSGQHVIFPQNVTCLVASSIAPSSGTWLDLGTATIKAKNANMIVVNLAQTLNRTVSDGVCSSSSSPTTFTSATAAFTSSDVGRSIYITGANVTGSSGDGQILFTTIAAYTNSTTVILHDACQVTVSAASTSIYNRINNVRVSGGTVASSVATGRNNGAPVLEVYGVDGFTIKDVAFNSSNGYASVRVDDATNGFITNLQMVNTAADGVHIDGPAYHIYAKNLIGSNLNDDIFAVTAHGWPGTPNTYLTYGPVADVVADTLSGNNAGCCAAVKLIGGTSSTPITDITARNIWGGNVGTLVDLNTETPAGSVTIASGILIDGVHASGSGGSSINLSPSAGKDITIRNLFDSAFVTMNTETAGGAPSIQSLLIDGFTFTPQSTPSELFLNNAGTLADLNIQNGTINCTATAVTFCNAATINNAMSRVSFAHIHANYGTTDYGNIVNVSAATTDVSLNDIQISALNTSVESDLAYANAAVSGLHINDFNADFADTTQSKVFKLGASANLGEYALSNGRVNQGLALLYFPSGATVGRGYISGVDMTGISRMAQFLGPTIDIALNGVSICSPIASTIFTSGSAVTVRGSGFSRCGGSYTGFQRAASEVLHSINMDYPADITILTQTVGDRAYNTNATYQLGPLMSNGTNWYSMYATLVH